MMGNGVIRFYEPLEGEDLSGGIFAMIMPIAPFAVPDELRAALMDMPEQTMSTMSVTFRIGDQTFGGDIAHSPGGVQ